METHRILEVESQTPVSWLELVAKSGGSSAITRRNYALTDHENLSQRVVIAFQISPQFLYDLVSRKNPPAVPTLGPTM